MSNFIGDYITESKMEFGPYTKENRFKIEHSKLHKILGQGYKIVEFVALQDDKIIFVEAKPKNYILSIRNPKLEKKIKELKEKFENSLDLLLSVSIGFKIDEFNHIGSNILNNNLKVKGRFYVVIKDADDDLCMKLTNILQNSIRKDILGIHKIKLMVMNDTVAKEYKLIRES